MKKRPLVSVIIPTRNRAGLLLRALESARGQDYDDLQIIVVDDASGDGTREALAALRRKDERITYFSNPRPLGGMGARNAGIMNAKGEYVSFLDDDDEWLPSKVSRQVGFLEENPEVGAVSCWYIMKSGERTRKVKKLPVFAFDDILWKNFPGSFSFCLLRRSVFDSIDLPDETLPSAQDWDFWLKVSQKFRIGVVPEYLVLYHRHHAPKISSSYKDKLTGHRMIYDRYREYMDDKCRRHHLKYINFYASLSSHSSKDRLRHLVKLPLYFSMKSDIVFLLRGFCYALIPDEWIGAAKRHLSGVLAPRRPLIDDKELYKRVHKDEDLPDLCASGEPASFLRKR